MCHAKYNCQFSHRSFHPVLTQELLCIPTKDFAGNKPMNSSQELYSFLSLKILKSTTQTESWHSVLAVKNKGMLLNFYVHTGHDFYLTLILQLYAAVNFDDTAWPILIKITESSMTGSCSCSHGSSTQGSGESQGPSLVLKAEAKKGMKHLWFVCDPIYEVSILIK